MQTVSRILFGLGIFWSLLQLVAVSGLLRLAGADSSLPRGLVAAPSSIEMAWRNHFDCPLMRAVVAHYDVDQPILAVGLLEVTALCEGRSLLWGF